MNNLFIENQLSEVVQLSEIEDLKNLAKMDNLRLVWECYRSRCFAEIFIGSYQEKVLMTILDRLAPESKNLDWEPWGWSGGNKNKVVCYLDEKIKNEMKYKS